MSAARTTLSALAAAVDCAGNATATAEAMSLGTANATNATNASAAASAVGGTGVAAWDDAFGAADAMASLRCVSEPEESLTVSVRLGTGGESEEEVTGALESNAPTALDVLQVMPPHKILPATAPPQKPTKRPAVGFARRTDHSRDAPERKRREL